MRRTVRALSIGLWAVSIGLLAVSCRQSTDSEEKSYTASMPIAQSSKPIADSSKQVVDSTHLMKYEWNEDYCDHKAVFDTLKYTLTQIDNCRILTYYGYYAFNAGLENTARLSKPSDFEKLDVKPLDEEYKENRELLKSLELPKIEYWQELQDALLLDLDDFYKIYRLEYLAVDNPKVLKQYKTENAKVNKCANALIAGGDELTRVWLELREEEVRRWEEFMKKKGKGRKETKAITEEIREKTKQQLASKDKLLYAKIEVLTTWSLTAINSNDFLTRDWSFRHDNRFMEFKKLFVGEVEQECYEP